MLERAYKEYSSVLYDAIKMMQAGNVKRIIQADIHPVGFYCTARKSGDELLDWNMSSREIFNFMRAICKPGPEVRSFMADIEVRINKVEMISSAQLAIESK